MNQLVQYDNYFINLTSRRLTFRLPNLGDISLLHQHMTYDIATNIGSIPWPYKRDDAVYFINLRRDLVSRLDYVIHNIPQRQFIGLVSLHLNSLKRGEIGYWITDHQRSKSYATEAAQAICDLAALLHCPKVWMSIRSSNYNSINIAKKIGLQFTKECVHHCHDSIATFYIFEKLLDSR